VRNPKKTARMRKIVSNPKKTVRMRKIMRSNPKVSIWRMKKNTNNWRKKKKGTGGIPRQSHSLNKSHIKL
jgi:hypothetical protein